MTKFADSLQEISVLKKSLLTIGLDPDPDKMPVSDVFEFCKLIIDYTEDFTAAYKPNMGFFEAFGLEGLKSLEKVIDHIKSNYPDVLIIGDAKRGDIAPTSSKYAYAMFEIWDFDAVTVNAFSGLDSIEPFLKYTDRGIFVWCKSSNPDGYQLQDLIVKGTSDRKIFQIIAEYCVSWNNEGNLGVIVGATYPEELKIVRDIVGELPILVPGIGSQSGDLEASVRAGLGRENHGLLVSSSRGIIYASSDPNNFGPAAADASSNLRENINNILTELGRSFT